MAWITFGFGSAQGERSAPLVRLTHPFLACELGVCVSSRDGTR